MSSDDAGQHISTFLGKKLNPNFQGEAGNRYDVGIQGHPHQAHHGAGLHRDVR